MKQLRIVALALYVGSAVAGEGWPLEPKSFLGVELGVPYRHGTLPDCPEAKQQAHQLCVHGFFGRLAELHAIPIPDVDEGHIHLWDGDVVSVSLSFPAENHNDMRKLLEMRYGKPTSSQPSEVVTAAGVSVPSRTTSWSGKNVSILLLQRGARIDRGSIVVTSEPVAAAERQARETALREAASKL